MRFLNHKKVKKSKEEKTKKKVSDPDPGNTNNPSHL